LRVNSLPDLIYFMKNVVIKVSILLTFIYAHILFESKNLAVDRIAGSLHLVGEHVDIEGKEFTGNFPQVFVHAEIVRLIKELEKL